MSDKNVSFETQIDELSKYDGLKEIISQHFNVINKIGSGTFSSVYLATLKSKPDIKYALKHVAPTSHPSRTENELECLKTIGGQENVVHLISALRHFDNVIIIMNYMPHDHFQDYVSKMLLSEIQLYMRNLLVALKHVHKFNIIHRDIKPSNFLYDRRMNKFCLVDFGLAQKVADEKIEDHNESSQHSTPVFQKPNEKENLNEDILNESKPKASVQQRSCSCFGQPSICKVCICRPPQIASRAGTAGFRAPEVLLKVQAQTTAIDVWSAGVIYMSLLCGMHPILKPADDFTSLCQIISVFGSEEVIAMAAAHDKHLIFSSQFTAISLQKFCTLIRTNRDSLQKTKKNKQPKNSDDVQVITNNEACIDTLNCLDVDLINSNAEHQISDDDDCQNNSDISCTVDMGFRDSVFSLLNGLLELDPLKRLTAEQALEHLFFEEQFDS